MNATLKRRLKALEEANEAPDVCASFDDVHRAALGKLSPADCDLLQHPALDPREMAENHSDVVERWEAALIEAVDELGFLFSMDSWDYRL